MRFFNLLLILVLLASTASAQPRIGLQLYSFRKEIPKDVPGMLEKISKMGITYLEGGGLYNLDSSLYKDLLSKNELKVVSVGASFNELDSFPDRVLQRAKFFNAQFVVCTWIPHSGTEFGITEIQEAIDVFNKAGKFLQQNGLSFCYHPHGYEFRPYSDGTLFDHLIKNVDKRYVNFEMDVYWVKHGGVDPLSLLQKYPDRFPLFHLKDRRIGTEGNMNGTTDVETNVVLGDGDVNIGPLVKYARSLKTVKYFFLEDESSRSLEQVPRSISFLQDLK